MIRQRPLGAAPVVRAVAESLPFPDGAFDCALAVLTVHHWNDVERGLRELRRVADRQVLFAFDVDRQAELWFTADYLPESAELERRRAPSISRIVAALAGARVIPVLIPYDCTDGFCGAYWHRPRSFLDQTVRQSISSVAMLEPRTVEAAVERLRHDVEIGAWERRYGELMEWDELDLGYCLVVAGAKR
jgi:SAM-dependent methyltransferase